MQAYVSRNQLLTFFIDSCYLLEGYEEIERTLVGKLEKNEVKLQDLLKDYRERQKFQSLISMLIVASHYYFEKGEHHLATICLIECQCILENLDKDNLLKVYLLVELGFIYEVKGLFQEAGYYYSMAISVVKDRPVPILITYCFGHLVHIMFISGKRRSVERFYSWIYNYKDKLLSEELKQQIELVSFYITKRYDDVIVNIKHQSLIDDKFPIYSVLLNHSYYQIGLTEEIEWDLTLLSNPQPTKYGAYDLIYQLTYHLIYDNDEQLCQYIKRSCKQLKGMKQEGLLLLMYQFLCRNQRIIANDTLFDECESSLRELHKQLAYQTEILKKRHQSIYDGYQGYYNDLEIVRTTCKHKLVSCEQLATYYNYEYTSKTVVGYFKLNRCFYSEFKINQVNEVVETLNEFIGENITFCIEQEGLWFYFKASCGEVNLKRKLNRLVELWYEQIGESYFVSFCLPPYTTDSFEEMKARVRGNFYSMTLKPNSRLPYSVSFCQKSSPLYNLSVKIHHLLDVAYQKGDFKMNYTSLYHRDGNYLFGIECHSILDSHFLLNQLTKEERSEGKQMFIIEKEIYQFKLGCQYLSENYNDSSNKISLFITFSRQSLLNKFISSRILSYLNKYGIEPQQIIVGVNEDILFEQNTRIQKSIKRFRELGINIALDEYGAGSLTGSIRNLNIDYLRISSSLLQYLKNSNNYLNMMKSLLSVCSSKDVTLCYSEIDNESSLNLVRDFGIDVVSGSYYQRKLVV